MHEAIVAEAVLRQVVEGAIRLFLQAGVDINLQNKAGWTPLMVAIFTSSESAAKMLIDAGAKLDVQDARGYGPLHWAAYRGFMEVTRRLLEAGIPPDDMRLLPSR